MPATTMVLRGIELCNGGVLFYSLVWESIVAEVRFQDGELAGVELHPITLGHGLPRSQRGRPLLASGEMAEKIIGDLRRLSQPFGTELSFLNGIGVVRVR